MTRKAVSLFAIACMTFIITGPFAAWIVYKLAQPPGTFSNQVIHPGETFSQTKAGKTLAVWGAPASLEIQEVQCRVDDRPIKLKKERTTTDNKGNEVILLFDGNYTVFDRVSCEGGGLEEIHLSNRFPIDRARKIMIGSLVATPLVGGLGIVLFKRTRSFKKDR